MYPNSFNWMDLGEYGSIIRAQMSGRNKVYTIAIPRSKYYTTSLETQADEQVNKLLNAAVTYATNYYPSNPTYGIIEYFDKWICENNYYNYVGTYEDAVSKASREYYYCHSAYGILSNGYGVCESYALAMSRLLDAAQIRNQYVVGDTPGGGHAWNYVQMPDNKWYLLDSTWNDDGDSSNKLFLLISDDGDHKPTGKRFKGGKSFKFETRSKTNYAPASGDLIILKPKAKYNLAVKDSFYTKMVTGWSSSDESIVKVSADGQLTAGKNIGHTDIKMKLSSGEYPIKVYVNNYKVTSITNSNGKTSYDATWTTDYKPLGYAYPITFNVKQNGTDYSLTAEKLQKSASSSVAATTSNKKVVELYGAPAVTGNQIKLYVVPVKIGKSKITVKYGGKSASYTINVKKPIDESLFKFDINSDGYTYTGKAIKPKVTKASSLPGAYKDLKYKVTYKNNKDVGTASVIITGSGNYGGTVTKTFVIKPTTLTGDVQFVSCTESKVYNGARQEPKTKVKVGNKTLKQGSDYILQYKDSEGYTSTLKPKNVGTYTVSIKIKNYDISEETVTAAGTKTFEIKPTTIDKVKVTIPSLKYTSFDLIPGYNQDMVVKIGKNVLPSTDYTVEFKNSSGTEIVSNITDKGTYKIVITPTGSNVTAGKKTAIEKVIKIK
ncbi:MAG: transglutaminase domain-containing protein [Lachnospiraceae bacterium]|nr:transglutaminase domain-containing protein [Lachnospiraceae bacterium]